MLSMKIPMASKPSHPIRAGRTPLLILCLAVSLSSLSLISPFSGQAFAQAGDFARQMAEQQQREALEEQEATNKVEEAQQAEETAQRNDAENANPVVDFAITINIRGNEVLDDEVYRSLIRVMLRTYEGDMDRPNKHLGEFIHREILGFLRDAGYEIASVVVDTSGPQLNIKIDEGKLLRVYFLGISTAETLQLKWELNLPHEVFNRRILDRQIKLLKQRTGFEGTYYELVRLPRIKDIPSGFEVHVRMGKKEWPLGFSGGMNFDATDGLALRGEYAGRDILIHNDRWLFGAAAGGAYFDDLVGDGRSVRLSQAIVDGRWYTPPLFGLNLRPAVFSFAHLRGRQRRDLMIDNYNWLQAGAGGEIRYELFDGFVMRADMAAEIRYLFNVDQVTTIPPQPPVDAFFEGRTTVGLWLDWALSGGELRVDRQQRIMLGGKYYLGKNLSKIQGSYRNVFEQGWNDLWVNVRALSIIGDDSFLDDEPIDRHLRGMLAYQYYVQWVGVGGAEYRYSLRQDMFKVGGFVDLAVFQDPGRGNNARQVRGALSAGLGVHTLILDLLQFDIYLVSAISTEGIFDAGMTMGVTKAF